MESLFTIEAWPLLCSWFVRQKDLSFCVWFCFVFVFVFFLLGYFVLFCFVCLVGWLLLLLCVCGFVVVVFACVWLCELEHMPGVSVAVGVNFFSEALNPGSNSAFSLRLCYSCRSRFVDANACILAVADNVSWFIKKQNCDNMSCCAYNSKHKQPNTWSLRWLLSCDAPHCLTTSRWLLVSFSFAASW